MRVRMLDNSVKALLVDDAHSVEQLMVPICQSIGITNHYEYSLVWENRPKVTREAILHNWGGGQPYDKTLVPTTTLDFWFVCSPPVNTKQAHCRGLPLKQRSEVAGILGRLLFEFFPSRF